ncbi:MAG: DUF1499 domain-containing protein [Candidatus Lokiarchaeota archaeon]
MVNGKFYPCDTHHVCVSTMANTSDTKHYIEPIIYNTSLEEAKAKIKSIINNLKRTQLLMESENYMHFQFTTGLFRFKDDVEFLFNDKEKIIHFKSQSRIGGYDWNTNRNRMEKIKRIFLDNILSL